MRPWPALAFALALVAGDAFAHASLLSSTPADGEQLADPPAAVVLEFDEPVVPLSMTLVNERGEREAIDARAQVDGSRIVLNLANPVAEGGYVASYRIRSLDSHVIAGAIAFSVGGHTVPRHMAEMSHAPTLSGTALRSIQLAALLLTAGFAAYLLLVGDFPAQARWLWLMAGTLVAATLLGLEESADRMSYDASGQAPGFLACLPAAIALAGAACAGLGALLRHRPSQRLALVSATLLLPASIAAGGHAMTSSLRPLALGTLFTHLLGIAFWAGSLVALFVTLRVERAATAMRRFSAIAQVAVPVALAAGIVFAALEIRTVDNLGRDYGRLALLKLAISACLLAIAVRNRFVLLPRLEHGDPDAPRRLRATIAWEIVLVAMLVVAGATLASTAPPRHASIERVVDAGDLRAAIAVTPARTVDIRLSRAGQPVDVSEVLLEAQLPEASIGPVERRAVAREPGHYRVSGLPLTVPGTWHVVVRAQVDDFTRREFATEITLPSR